MDEDPFSEYNQQTGPIEASDDILPEAAISIMAYTMSPKFDEATQMDKDFWKASVYLSGQIKAAQPVSLGLFLRHMRDSGFLQAILAIKRIDDKRVMAKCLMSRCQNSDIPLQSRIARVFFIAKESLPESLSSIHAALEDRICTPDLFSFALEEVEPNPGRNHSRIVMYRREKNDKNSS